MVSQKKLYRLFCREQLVFTCSCEQLFTSNRQPCIMADTGPKRPLNYLILMYCTEAKSLFSQAVLRKLNEACRRREHIFSPWKTVAQFFHGTP